MDMVKYFFECYFYVGEDYENLDMLIEKFKKLEKKIYQEQFISELSMVIENRDYHIMLNHIEKFGFRKLSFAKTRILTIFIYKRLMEIPTSIVPEDFCDMKTLSKKALMEGYDIFENPKDS